MKKILFCILVLVNVSNLFASHYIKNFFNVNSKQSFFTVFVLGILFSKTCMQSNVTSLESKETQTQKSEIIIPEIINHNYVELLGLSVDPQKVLDVNMVLNKNSGVAFDMWCTENNISCSVIENPIEFQKWSDIFGRNPNLVIDFINENTQKKALQQNEAPQEDQ